MLRVTEPARKNVGGDQKSCCVCVCVCVCGGGGGTVDKHAFDLQIIT